MQTKIINLFGGPCSLKSATMRGLVNILNASGLETEMAPEAAKDIVWSGHQEDFKYQYYVTSEQAYRIDRLIGKVQYVVTDSPILLGTIYAPPNYFPNYKPFLWDMHRSHNSINVFLNRVLPYNPNGRNQTEEEAKALDRRIYDLYLLLNNTHEMNGNSDAPGKIKGIILDDRGN